jgi:hypothetical protein
MAKKTIEIMFPEAGVVRRLGHRVAAGGRGPYPTPWATNVRLEDALTNRLRGGSFTGISAGARSAIVYRDRSLVFQDQAEGDISVTQNSNAIYCSRQGYHGDFDFGRDISDVARPTVFQLSEADAVGGDVKALCPKRDAHLLGWTADETWVLSGDPTTGSLRRVSDEVGIIAEHAWCAVHNTIYFLSSQGLYAVVADGSGLRPISEDVIPEDLTSVSDTACTLTYNHADRGVYIHLSSGVSWFYDTARKGFWPFETDTTDSHVLLGPFQLGRGTNYGRVLNLHGNPAASSADVAWRIVTGGTAEDAAANGKLAIVAAVAGNDYSDYVSSSGTWTAGRAHMAYPRTRAVWCCVWLSSTGTWAFEQAILTAVLSGPWR